MKQTRQEAAIQFKSWESQWLSSERLTWQFAHFKLKPLVSQSASQPASQPAIPNVKREEGKKVVFSYLQSEILLLFNRMEGIAFECCFSIPHLKKTLLNKKKEKNEISNNNKKKKSADLLEYHSLIFISFSINLSRTLCPCTWGFQFNTEFLSLFLFVVFQNVKKFRRSKGFIFTFNH